MNAVEFLSNARRIVQESAVIARKYFGQSTVLKEKARHDIVTEADLGVEKYVVEALSKLYPQHGFYAEEGGKVREDAEYRWILDPIDGTKYYARTIPLYAISLALEHRGELLLGVVCNPQSDQMFHAARDYGAWLNEQKIHCSEVSRLEDAVLCVEMPSRDSDPQDLAWSLDRLREIVPRVRRVRILGVSALSLSYCAIGGFDAYVNLGSGSHYYDYAAGQIIVTQAGAQFHNAGGRIIAGPKPLFDQLTQLLQK